MNEEYFQLELTRAEAENVALSLPQGYTLVSTQMKYGNRGQGKQLHEQIIFDTDLQKLQLWTRKKLNFEENRLVNETLMVIESDKWRFQLLEDTIKKYEENQELIGIEEIRYKVIRQMYKTLNGFLADLKCLMNNNKLKSINKVYRQQASILDTKLQKLKERCDQMLETKCQFVFQDSHISQKASTHDSIFTKEQLRELENNLHQLHNKYLYGIRNLIGNQSITERKGTKSEELNLLKLSVQEQKRLLAYSRKCLKEQEAEARKLKMEDAGDSDFESD